MLTSSLTNYEKVVRSIKQTYYSHGKLMLTGEYIVLNGATALVLPLSKGQMMEVEYLGDSDRIIQWVVDDINGEWFYGELHNDEMLSVVYSNNQHFADKLIDIISKVKQLNPQFLSGNGKYKVVNRISFDRNWGLGTSSTFLSNISYWAEVDPFKLNSLVSRGSGYDIAAARTGSPFLYRLNDGTPEIRPVTLAPKFWEQICFIYLGVKMDTSTGIDYYENNCKVSTNDLESINEISNTLFTTNSVYDFVDRIKEHERILSAVLKMEPIQNKLFKDFDGVVKSLGTWGGDFAMVASENSFDYVASYFRNKGYTIIFRWNELIL